MKKQFFYFILQVEQLVAEHVLQGEEPLLIEIEDPFIFLKKEENILFASL